MAGFFFDMQRLSTIQKKPWFPLSILGTILVIIFDVARKTVFLGSSWNYQYPEWSFVYDPVAIFGFVLSGLLVILFTNKLAELREDRFIAVLLLSTVFLSGLAFFVTPEKSFKWALTPYTPGPVESFQYYPATIAAEDGLGAFFSNFHSAQTLSGSNRIATTKALTEWLRSAEFLIWNDLLADYASDIVTQRHGPIPGLLIAPFLKLLGSSPRNAVIGSYLITITLPVLSLILFRSYFSKRQARLGSLFVLMAPAYLIYQRYGTVSYDVITAIIVTASVIIFLAALRKKRRSLLVLSGLVFSGAILSKISILTMGAAFLPLIHVYSENFREALSNLVTFSISILFIPTSLLFFGYNFIVQFLYDIARIQMSEGAAASNPVLSWLTAVYNVRLIGVVVLIFTISFAISLIVKRNFSRLSNRDYISIAFLLPLMPFFALKGITLSRHLVPLLPMIVFVGLHGFERVMGRSFTVPEGQVGLTVTLLLTLVNL